MNFFAYLILFLGSLNLIRMTLYLIGSDLYVLFSIFSDKKVKKKLQQKNYTPFISVVIPAKNESITIVRAIASVFDNTYPENKYEVIAMDDGSTDDTYQKALNYKREKNLSNLKVIHQVNMGKSTALNNGFKKYAKGELLMCLDSDSYLAPDALEKVAKYFLDEHVMAVGGNIKIRDNGTLLNLIQKFEYLICYQMKRAQTTYNMEYIIGGIGSTFRKTMMEKINYYDVDTVTEDIDLTMKIIRKGNIENKIMYGADVIAYTESVPTIRELVRQRFRWKWGRCQTFYKNRQLFFNSDKKYSRQLTFLNLPFAIFSDVAFFLEPIVIGYLLYIIFMYGDALTFLSSLTVISLYVIFMVLNETTLTLKEKVILTFIAPTMYLFFYILSLVEYIALLKTIIGLPHLKKSIEEKFSKWVHVTRSTTQFSFDK